MFVLSVAVNASTAEMLKVVAWVYEGCVHRGDSVTWLAHLKVTSYGWTEDSELEIYYQFKDIQPVEIEINRIEKHRDFEAMERGYSGAFYLKAASEKYDGFLRGLLEDDEFQDKRENRRATREQPKEYAQIHLFDSRSTADTWLAALPHRDLG